MLKSNDVEAYKKLVQSAKNSRLSQLLQQTDACLDKLAARLKVRPSSCVTSRNGGGQLKAEALHNESEGKQAMLSKQEEMY